MTWIELHRLCYQSTAISNFLIDGLQGQINRVSHPCYTLGFDPFEHSSALNPQLYLNTFYDRPMQRLLPQTGSLKIAIQSGADLMMDFEDGSFSPSLLAKTFKH